MNRLKEVLLVDDSKGTNSLHSRLLKEMDVVDTISVALNGQQALDYLETKNGEGVCPAPVVIFLDNNMPVMDGYQFLEKYENLGDEFKPAKSIVMVSSSDDDSDKMKTAKFPFVKHCLSKPLRREDVKAIIDEVNDLG